LEKKEMQLSICGSYADATDRAVFPAAVNKKKIKFKEGFLKNSRICLAKVEA